MKSAQTGDAARIVRWLREDSFRWHVLGIVQSLGLPDGWIAAGFIRNMVWDRLHGRPASPITGDVDVIWHDRCRPDAETDRAIEASLRAIEPSVDWSVKNQARMHIRNGDVPYASATDAMRFWPETATAVAARRSGPTGCEIAAPLGYRDLFDLTLRPAPRFIDAKRSIYDARIRDKGWTARWPDLRIARVGDADDPPIRP